MSAGPWTRWRRAVQALCALLWLALPVLADPRLTGTAVALRVGPLELLEPAAALSAALSAASLPAALALGILPLAALAATLGPVACSWACPYGLLSEGLDALRRRGARWPAGGTAGARPLRLATLAALLGVSALLGAPLAALLSPPRLVSALPLEAWSSRAVPWTTLGLLAFLLALELLAPRRLVCRGLCPARAVASLLRRPFTWAPRFTAGRCRCPEVPACVQACPWGLDPRERSSVGAGCTSCMACIDRCPSGALVALRRR